MSVFLHELETNFHRVRSMMSITFRKSEKSMESSVAKISDLQVKETKTQTFEAEAASIPGDMVS
jgi:hypothetical protein